VLTEEQWNANEAADIVQIVRDPVTDKALCVVVVDTTDAVAQEFDKNLARAVAVRLVELAALLPDPPRILRRATDIDEQLRGLEP